MDDMQRFATEVTTDLVKSFIRDVAQAAGSKFAKKYSYLMEDFSTYLEQTYAKCSNVRTIINKDRSYPIDKIYVPAYFQNGDGRIIDNELISDIVNGQATILVGFGGIGKTVFTKHLWMTVFNNSHGLVPVFIELRQLNKITDIDIYSYIRHLISNHRKAMREEIFFDFLDDGRFLFIFDGFDELTEDKRNVVEEAILELRHRYPSCRYVVSSRHDDRFNGWQQFVTYKACAFSKSQVLDLVERIDYDKDIKKKFVVEIVNRKYDEYSSFLSTPLLILMMLMTFSQFAEVPDKRHIFYRYAFLTLYSWHDASKEAFRRESKTGLVVDQFEKVFSIFCLLTYLEREFSLDELSMRHYVEKTKSYIDFNFDTGQMIKEIVESVNFMYKDGDVFVFTHRSFQEYFAAFSVINFFSNRMRDLTERMFAGSDITLPLMYEINGDVVEENYILPVYGEIKTKLVELCRIRDIEKLSNELEAITLIELDLKQRRGKGKALAGNRAGYLMFGGTIFMSDLYRQLLRMSSFFPNHEFLEGRAPLFGRGLESIIQQIAKSIINDADSDGLLVAYLYGDDKIYWNVDSVFPVSHEDIRKGWESVDVDVSKIVPMVKKSITDAKALAVFIQRKAEKISKKNISKQRSIDDILG